MDTCRDEGQRGDAVAIFGLVSHSEDRAKFEVKNEKLNTTNDGCAGGVMPSSRTLSLMLTVVIAAGSAWAHDSGTPFAAWMKSLVQPLYPASSCCGPADQFYVREYQPSKKEGIAFVAIVAGDHGKSDFPVEIPSETVIWNRVNPTGRGVVFIEDHDWGRSVVCFVPGIGL